MYLCEINETIDSNQNIFIVSLLSALSFPFLITLNLRKESTKENKLQLLSHAVANRQSYKPPVNITKLIYQIYCETLPFVQQEKIYLKG